MRSSILVLALVALPAVARAEVDPPKRISISYAGPRLGVQVVEMTEELRTFMGAAKDAGVLVGKVAAGSAAEKAGIKVGDVLVSVATRNVADANDVRRALSANKEGAVVAVQVVRDRRPVVLSVTVPKPEQPGSLSFDGDGPERLFSVPEFHGGPGAMRFFGSDELDKRLDAIEQRLEKLEKR